jgi:hypothetical protein
MRFLFALLLLTGCSIDSKVKRLSDVEYSHYYALRPFMSEEDRKEYLKLKTETERNQWLKDHNLWDVFYKYDEKTREAIVSGLVQKGWNKEMVYMAWGAPYQSQKLAGRPASKSELLVYRFEQHEDGVVLVWIPGSKTEYKAIGRFTREVYIDDNAVTEIVQKDGWPQ